MIFTDIKILDENFDVTTKTVVTKGDKIVCIGDDTQKILKNELRNPSGLGVKLHEVVDGKGKFLMPAFYNTHCHVPMTLLRGYGEGLPLQRWLKERIFPFEAKFLAEYKYWGAALGALELMKSGCVSISDMYFDLPEYGRALYEAGMKANLCNGLVNFNEEDSYYHNNAYKDTENLIAWIKSNSDDRIKADAALHSEYSTKEKAVRELADFAKENNLIVQGHVSETKTEHEECIARHGASPIKYLEKCGILDSPFIAAHCVWLEDEDVDIMRKHSAVVSHNPSSNLKLGSGIAPIKTYHDRGVRITIGTDGASSNNNLNVLEELNLASLLCRGQSLDANAISQKDLIKFATHDGALAQGRTDCGLIKEGYKADFIVFDMDKEHLTPDYDTLANVIFSASASDICMTVCDGKVICKYGKSTLLDEEEIKAKAKESFAKILKSL